MNQKAVVVGATGLIGKELVQLLLRDSAYTSVTVLVRRCIGISDPKLHEKLIDFDLLDKVDVDMNGADVYCALGTTRKDSGSQEAFRRVDYTYPLALARMAKHQGARGFIIVSAIGADSSSRTFYVRVKGELEDALKELKLPALHIFRPSLLLGDREQFRFGERMAQISSKIFMPLFVGVLRKYKPISAGSVAKAMLLAAKSGQSGTHIYESDEIEIGTEIM